MLVDGFRYIEQDAKRLGWTCTLLLSVTILICFRSLRWMLISVGVVQLALLLTRGLLVWSGLQMSMVSSMLTAIVTVVGIATVVHLIVRFRESRLNGLAPREALRRTGGLVAMPVFWSIVTDVVGFGSLMIAGVGPVRDFGLMMAVGSLMVLVAVILLVPGLALLGWHPAAVRSSWVERVVVGRLSRTLAWVEHRPWTLAGLLAIVLGGTAAAPTGWKSRRTSPRTSANAARSSRLTTRWRRTWRRGSGTCSSRLPTRSAGPSWTGSETRRPAAAGGHGAGSGRPAHGGIKVLSMADTIEAGAPSLHKTRSGLRQALVLSGAIASLREHMPAISEVLYAEDPQAKGKFYFRIMLRAVERQPAQQKLRLIDDVTRISREAFPRPKSPGSSCC